jgi:hypothetical protein
MKIKEVDEYEVNCKIEEEVIGEQGLAALALGKFAKADEIEEGRRVDLGPGCVR